MSGVLLSVNVGRIEEVPHHDRTVTTGIFKRPVAGRVATHGVNVDGDDQADRSVHGGPDRALYAYAGEDLECSTGFHDCPPSVVLKRPRSGLSFQRSPTAATYATAGSALTFASWPGLSRAA